MNFEQDLGKVGITPAGAWSNTTDYERLTMVTWRGRSYVSKTDNRGVEPGTNTNVWMLVAEKGEDGQGGGGGGQGGGDTIGIARHTDGLLYWTKNGVWLLDEYGNKVKAQGVDGKDGKDGKDGEGGSSGGGGDVVSKFKSYVFIRSQNAPATPQGGSYDNPVPAGWYDGIPAGELQVWTSSRWFYSDDTMTAQTSWSEPIATTDTADIDFEFSSVEEPGNPSTNPGYWHDPAVTGDKWMAIRVKRNGIWLGWSVMQVAGEDGKDGKDGASFNVLGSYDTMEEAMIAHPDPNRNDVVIIDGEMYIWDGEQWASMGLETTLGTFLDSYALLIPGTATAAKASTYIINAWAQKGTQLISATIGTITGMPTGMSVSLSDNGTDHPSITFTVTDSLVLASGQIVVPITAGGETHRHKLSWAVAFTGAAGATGGTGPSGSAGNSTVSLQLYQRAASAPDTLPGTLSYNFSNDTLSGQRNGWERTPPANDGNPLWMIQAYKSASGTTVNIGTSSWNGPIKFVEDGHPGKTMRGPSQWAANINYQGLGNSGEGFVDLVYLNQNYSTLYYCKQNHTSSNSNKPGTSGGDSYWEQAEVSEFLATRVFFANLGYVENLGVHYLRISDSGAIVGGFMPANTTDPDTNTNINGDTMLWVGGATPSSSATHFKVDKYGDLTATNVNLSGAINATSGAFTGTVNATSGNFSGVVRASRLYQNLGLITINNFGNKTLADDCENFITIAVLGGSLNPSTITLPSPANNIGRRLQIKGAVPNSTTRLVASAPSGSSIIDANGTTLTSPSLVGFTEFLSDGENWIRIFSSESLRALQQQMADITTAVNNSGGDISVPPYTIQ